MAKAKNTNKKIVNRRARFDYELGDTLVVGIQLTGPETKALRTGHAQLVGSYVALKDNELWLINATINAVANGFAAQIDPTRTRKLLANRREIEKLQVNKQQNLAIVPLEFMTSSKYIKLRIAVGRGRKKYDKRQIIKAREESRKIRKEYQ
jgi:SsrA-binding protein